MSEEISEAYKSPESNVEIANVKTAPVYQVILAFVGIVLYAASNILVAINVGKTGAELVGTAVGSIFWPLVVVGISQIWKSNRNSKTRVKVFLITTIVLILLQVIKPK